MVFFEPRDEFLVWLLTYAKDRVVFDVGCGTGVFLERMWQMGIKAIGVELYVHKIENVTTRMRVFPQDARECSALRTMPALVLFCRPSHDGWVHDTIPLLHPESEVLYISKPGNEVMDVPYDVFTRELLDPPGCEEEYVWRVSPIELRSTDA